MTLRKLISVLVIGLVSAFAPARAPQHQALRATASDVAASVPWHVKTKNAWTRLLQKEMGLDVFVGSRAKRIAMKINPMTECITEEECLVEIEEAGEFFEGEEESS
mmetsp:Transcript_26411/g.79196  ORF Transcript_26411/g.79196 Transcript_26411/m.79196 type:complete len:106 (-) Transcript_26411:55-372(-)